MTFFLYETRVLSMYRLWCEELGVLVFKLGVQVLCFSWEGRLKRVPMPCTFLDQAYFFLLTFCKMSCSRFTSEREGAGRMSVHVEMGTSHSFREHPQISVVFLNSSWSSGWLHPFLQRESFSSFTDISLTRKTVRTPVQLVCLPNYEQKLSVSLDSPTGLEEGSVVRVRDSQLCSASVALVIFIAVRDIVLGQALFLICFCSVFFMMIFLLFKWMYSVRQFPSSFSF